MTQRLKHKIAGVVILLIVAFIVFGQKPDLQAEFKAAQKRVVDSESARNSAEMALQAAVAERNALLFKMMAEAGEIKPSECAENGNPFACVKINPQTGDVSFERKKKTAP